MKQLILDKYLKYIKHFPSKYYCLDYTHIASILSTKNNVLFPQ